jgi:hypothetical protein
MLRLGITGREDYLRPLGLRIDADLATAVLKPAILVLDRR